MDRVTRRKFLGQISGCGGMLVLSAAGGVGYMSAVEPRRLVLERVDVRVETLPSRLGGFRIVQLSDIHCGPDVRAQDIARAVSMSIDLEPDLVVLTGDYVYQSASYADACAGELAPLARATQALACLGNHDCRRGAVKVAGALTKAGIVVLRNEARCVRDGLWVGGLDDALVGWPNVNRVLRQVPSDATLLVLVHEPDYADVVAATGRVALQLSGHSHGGQVRIPLVGAPVLPILARKYPAGLYDLGQMRLYVNRGVGLTRPAIRFNCRPEVTLITLLSPE
ncbi:MAG: metallophosphoesterase [Chloroflexi bacterium]|nr:metallophosphoesterase [Chloroflexota bacterium]